MDNLVAHMNGITSRWKETYDIFSCVQLEFSVDADMFLCLNNIQLCPIQPMFLHSVTYEAAHIAFFFEDTSQILISISWPEQAVPVVSAVQFTSSPENRQGL